MLVALTSLVAKILCLEGTAAVPTLDWSTLRVLVAENLKHAHNFPAKILVLLERPSAQTLSTDL
jgi:hypothetical protein